MISLLAALGVVAAIAPRSPATAPPPVSPPPSADASGDDDKRPLPKPTAGLFEVGLFGGVLFPSKSHNFQNELRSHQAFATAAPDFGLRLGFAPLAFLAVELEGALMPTRTELNDDSALWATRGHVLGQLPLFSVAPFVVVGGGRMGAVSNAVGSDSDPLLYVGAGVKAPLDQFLAVRLDVRDNLTQKTGADDGSQTHHPEVLFTLAFVLGRPNARPARPMDVDRDGVLGYADRCPMLPGDSPDGCPNPDPDGDGVTREEDRCPEQAGAGPDGCPVADQDSDGILDDRDRCPKRAGLAPDGCPDPDADKDGIEAQDQCEKEPETVNGFQDEDGCPDTLPEDVERMLAAKLQFDADTPTLTAAATATLDEIAKVLATHPSLRLVLVARGSDSERLGEERAAAVKQYLADHGVAANRLEVRAGNGSDSDRAVDLELDSRREK
jgi:OOP family OmpA-OmpF porin